MIFLPLIICLITFYLLSQHILILIRPKDEDGHTFIQLTLAIWLPLILGMATTELCTFILSSR